MTVRGSEVFRVDGCDIEKDYVGIVFKVAVCQLPEGGREEIVGVKEQDPAACGVADSKVAGHPSACLPLVAEEGDALLALAWIMAEIHLPRIAMVIHDYDFHIFAPGDGIQAAPQKLRMVPDRDDYGVIFHIC